MYDTNELIQKVGVEIASATSDGATVSDIVFAMATTLIWIFLSHEEQNKEATVETQIQRFEALMNSIDVESIRKNIGAAKSAN